MSIETLIACACKRKSLPPDVEPPIALTRKHGLGPLAFSLGAASFRNELIASSLIHEQQERSAIEAVEVLADRGIPVMLIKGIAAARLHYDEPGERPMRDIDLLVPSDAHREAADSLLAIGYSDAGPASERGAFHHARTLKKTGAAIDLHRSIVQPIRRGAKIRGLWQRAIAAPSPLGSAVLAQPTDEALITLAHIARHELAVRGLSYVDAARMLACIDRGILEERAREAKLWRGVRTAMKLTDALTANHSPARLARLHHAVLEQNDVGRSAQLYRKVMLVEGPLEAARLITGALLEKLGL